MRLKFRIELKKTRGPRIAALRVSRDENGKIIEKSLGSLGTPKKIEHIRAQLEPEELYELENFLKVARFSEVKFNCPADKLDRFIIKAAPDFKTALVKIWQEAKKYDVEFLPDYEMLLAALHKAKIIEQQLALITDGEFQALPVDITDLDPPKKSLSEEQKLFTALLDNFSTAEISELFNKLASEKYHKSPKFKPHHFDFLQQQKEKGKKLAFPKWYYTIAIDVLEKKGFQVEKIVSPPCLTRHWLRLNQHETVAATVKAFGKQFSSLKNNPVCLNLIQAAFIEEELKKMARSQQAPPASLAVEFWLKRQEEKYKDAKPQTLMQNFAKAFPLSAQNGLIKKILAKNLAGKTEI